MACFKVLFQNLVEGTENNIGKPLPNKNPGAYNGLVGMLKYSVGYLGFDIRGRVENLNINCRC
jgi:hypothetical protein